MGLDTTHNAWHGPYSTFNSWRTKIAELAGFPPLELMEGFYFKGEGSSDPFILLNYDYPKGDEIAMSALRRFEKRLPIKWDLFEGNALVELLTHSDCEGDIPHERCAGIAAKLQELMPSIEKEEGPTGNTGYWKGRTEQFIDGLLLAAEKKENLVFG